MSLSALDDFGHGPVRDGRSCRWAVHGYCPRVGWSIMVGSLSVH